MLAALRRESRRTFCGLLLGCLGLACGTSDEGLLVSNVQGRGALSPVAGEVVTVTGVVTAVDEDAGTYFVQSSRADRSDRTSEGLRVRGRGPLVGDLVRVRGLVREEQRDERELPVTTLAAATPSGDTVAGDGAELLDTIERGVPAPSPVELPSAAALASARSAFAAWEAREGMLVRLERATVIGPASRFGEIAVLPDGWARDAPRTRRGGLLDDDADRPRRDLLVLDGGASGLGALAGAAVGDRVETPLLGVADYAFGSHRLLLTAPPEAVVPAPAAAVQPNPRRETAGELAIATLNVENLDLGDSPSRFRALARFVVERLRSPDLLLLEEVQDDSGPADDGQTSSDGTLRRLADAIGAAGGPRYEYRYVRPIDGEDGGEPGGNIRSVLLVRRDGELRFVDRPPLAGRRFGTVALSGAGEALALRPSPGRIGPEHSAFRDSRKPLVVELRAAGGPLWVVGLHLVSKRADDPVAGSHQPPVLRSRTQRTAQAREVAALVAALLAARPDARVVVLGDLNDGLDSPAVAVLERAGLVDLLRPVPAEDRYTYVFQGRSQLLDHVLASPALLACCSPRVAIVHGNADSPADRRVSDHDSVVAALLWPPAPRDAARDSS